MQKVGVIASLHYYPIKSCRGIDCSSLTIDEMGPLWDRALMLVTREGVFLSQRRHRKMALISTQVVGEQLVAQAPGIADLVIDPYYVGASGKSKIWQDEVGTVGFDDEVDSWFQTVLDAECHLVRLEQRTGRRRKKEALHALFPEGFCVNFTDGYPFLLTNESSLADLNDRLTTPLPMNRFRPNIVITGAPPFAEDGWSRLHIGEVSFPHLKPCERCVITTIDQDTAQRGPEPLATLLTYRDQGEGIMFGQNLIHAGTGQIKVGDEVWAEPRS